MSRKAEVEYVSGRGWMGLPGFQRFTFDTSSWGGDPTALDAFIESTAIRFLPSNRMLQRCSTLRLDAFTTVSAQLSPGEAVWDRTGHDTRERYLAVFVHDGVIRTSLPTRSVEVRAGQICLLTPGDGTVRLLTETGTTLTLFSFETSGVSACAPRGIPDGMLTLVTAESAPVFVAIAAYLRGLLQAPQHPGDDVASLRRLTADVAASIVDEARGQTAGAEGDTLVHQVRRLITRQHRDLSCTPATLAQQLGVSRRRLEQECRLTGMHLADELRRVRASSARDDIVSHPDLALTKIAASSGFSSVDTLRRALRRYCGVSPTQLRHRAPDTDTDTGTGI